MNLHGNALADLKRSRGISAYYRERGARQGRLRNIHCSGTGIRDRERLSGGIAHGDIAKAEGRGASRKNSRAGCHRRSGPSLCGAGVAGATRQANHGQERGYHGEQQGRLGQFRILDGAGKGCCGRELGVGMVSHVAFSVESEGRAQLLVRGSDKVSPLSPVQGDYRTGARPERTGENQNFDGITEEIA